jgi:hypothetical protein
MNADDIDPRTLADSIFEAGSNPDEVGAALDILGDRKSEFLSRLAARAVLREAAGIASEMGTDDGHGVASASLIARVQADYEAERGRAPPSRPKDLSRLPAWIAAKSAFGNDVSFVIKLAGRHVTPPSARFLRYAADALGVAFAQVREHFSEGLPRGVVGAEHKASGKPANEGIEDFAAAVRVADIPEDLRARWLAE